MLRRLVLIVVTCSLALGVVTATPAAAATKTQAIPFTAATVTQTATGYDVAWKAPSSAGAVKVYAGTDPTDVGTSDQVGSGKSTDTITVTGLAAAPRWYFELVPAKGGSLVIADRSLHLASAPNFRDVGGYRTSDGKWVKMGLLYRSDGLDALTDADIATVQALGIKLVCDLRTDGERTSKPDKAIPGATNEQINIIGEDELTARDHGRDHRRRQGRAGEVPREREGRAAPGRRRQFAGQRRDPARSSTRSSSAASRTRTTSRRSCTAARARTAPAGRARPSSPPSGCRRRP